MPTSQRRFVLPLLLLVVPLAGAQEPAPPALRAVPGRLVAKGADGPLRGAWVQVFEAGREREELDGLGLSFTGWVVPPGARPVSGDGGFELELADGEYTVVAGAEGCETEVFDLEVTEVPHGRALEVPLPWVGVAHVSLRVVDAAAAPVTSFALTLHERRGFALVDIFDVTTDGEGRAAYARRPGSAKLSAEPGPLTFPSLPDPRDRRRCPEVDVTLMAGATTAVELRLLGPAHRAGLHVLVVDRDDAPVGGAFVALQPASVRAEDTWRLLGPDGSPPRGEAVNGADWNARALQTDAAGLAHFLDEDRRGEPPADEEVVVVARRSYDVGRVNAKRAPGEPSPVRVVLDTSVARGRVRLHLQSPGGAAFHGMIGWTSADADGALGHAFADETDEVLVIHDLAPGAATIVLRGFVTSGRPALGVGGGMGGGGGNRQEPDPVKPREPGLVARLEVQVVAGETTVQTVTLEPALLVEARLLLPDGTPYHGQVSVRLEARGGSSPSRTTRDGVLWISLVHPGDAISVGVSRGRREPALRVAVKATSDRQELRLVEDR